MGMWSGLRWSSLETGGGACECGNETWGSVKCGEFLE